MQPLMRLVRRVVYWLRFRARQADLREELAFHHEQLTNHFQRQGLSPDAARITARRELGNETYMREEARGVWLSAGLDAGVQDCRYAWRSLRRSPGFTAVVVLTLALGIGANTAIFSVVHHLILAPLPYPDGNRIVRLEMVPAGDPDVGLGVPPHLLRQWEVRAHTLEDFAAVGDRRYVLGGDAAHDTVAGASITPSFPRLLRVRATAGRDFTPDEARVGTPPVMMIGYGLWQTRYGGARDVLGKTLRVNGVPRVIVGVAPIHMGIPMSGEPPPEIWLPMSTDSAGGGTAVFARLRSGSAPEAAARELQSMMTEPADTGFRARVMRARDLVGENVKHAIEMLFAATGGLLLIACANIASLLLMRGWSRQREVVIRRALGASRLRLARHALTESLLLAIIGGGLGLVLAWGGLHTIIGLGGEQLSDLDRVHIDRTVLLWTTIIAMASGMLFGITPALFSGDESIGDRLRAGVRSAVGSSAARRLRGGMIIAEVALSFVFLVAAGLLIRSFVALERPSIGYDRAGLVAVRVRFAHEPARADREFIEQSLVRALRATPGVSQATLGGFPGALLEMNVGGGPFATEGPGGVQTTDLPFCEMEFVGPEYFRVVPVPLLQGRGFDARGGADASRKLIVNRSLARRFWPGGNALGAKLRVGDGTWLTVVGVAGDLHVPGFGTGDLFNLQMYRPTSAPHGLVNTVVLRMGKGASPAALAPMLKVAVENAGISATLRSVDPAESTFDRLVLARPRLALVLFGFFATIALAVSAVGLYAIVAYAVEQRTREIGVRVALGAEPVAVARLILGANVRLVIVGGLIGVLGAYATTRTLTTFLYGMSPTDPFAFGGAALLLGTVALFASFIPVRRALRIDPMDALRAE
jgi:putative ABC transport system permease protein